jgi:hypothetical protein
MRIALLAAAVVVAPLAIATPAQAGCVTTTRTVSGRLAGADHRYVDAMLGFVLKDKDGRYVNAKDPGSSSYGCTGPLMYGVAIRMNRTLPATGSTTEGTKSWSIKVPTNVTTMHIEVYPKNAEGEYDDSRYGWAYRRSVKVPYGTSVNIRLPVVCAVGGTTGHIHGYVTKNGVRVKADRVAAWGMAADNNSFSPILGWRVGTARDDGYYKIPNLESGQTYTVKITKDGKTYQRYGVAVEKCKNTSFHARF